MNKFVYGNSERIFVNTNIGCKAKCSYCYLPSLNICYGDNKISAAQAIGMVESLDYYKKGTDGSIISIGCYSECMDSENINETLLLVQHFLQAGNYIQLATKKEIDQMFLQKVSPYMQKKHQLWIYISLPVITNSDILEKGTDAPDKRIRNFALCNEYGIDSVLYIKPFIEDCTGNDIEIYKQIIGQYNVPAVVGEMLSTDERGAKVLVGEDRLFGHGLKNIESFILELEKVSKIYMHSTDCIR